MLQVKSQLSGRPAYLLLPAQPLIPKRTFHGAVSSIPWEVKMVGAEVISPPWVPVRASVGGMDEQQ